MFNPFRKTKQGVVHFYTKRSTLAFFSTLAILLALIALSHYLRTPDPEPVKAERAAKKTAIYSATSPVYLQAISTVKKEGVTPIVALTSGIVTELLVKPGATVQNGTTLLTITNDYNSGAAGLEKSIAKNNLELSQVISELDEDIQDNQEEIAENDDLFTRREREIELKTLEKDRETSEITLRNAELNYRLATVSDAVLKPRALSSGTVQSIAVKRGDFVSPGTTLAIISNSTGNTILEAFVTSEIAPYIDITKEAKVTLSDGSVVNILPNYFSASEDQDGMFMIQFLLPDGVGEKISTNINPNVSLPLRFTHEATILVPLDAVFKTSDEALVLVNVNGKAESRNVTLGQVRGNYIEVLSGLGKDDQIILNRFVLAGDSVEVSAE